MKPRYCICLFFVFSFVQSFALPVVQDTIAREKYQLSKKEFLATYGKDDSSIALINFYYDHRNLKKGHRNFYLAISILEAVLIGKVIINKDDLPLEESDAKFTLAVYSVVVFIPLTVYSLFKLNQAQKKFPKRQLYLDLLDYQAGRGLPEKYREQIWETPAYWKAR